MPKLTDKMPSFEGVGAGQTATLRLPIGQTYESLQLEYSGLLLSDIAEIRVIANGKTFRRYVGAELINTINKFDRMRGADGVLVMNFVRYGLITRLGREKTALPTGMAPTDKFPVTITTLQLEVDIKDTATVTAPALTVRAKRTPPQPLLQVMKVRQFTYNSAGANEYEISDLPRGEIYNRVFFKSDHIDRLVIERNGRIIYDRTKAGNELDQRNGVRTPQPGFFVYDPTEEGYGTEALVTQGLNDLRFRLYMSDADQIGVTLETIGVLER